MCCNQQLQIYHLKKEKALFAFHYPHVASLQAVNNFHFSLDLMTTWLRVKINGWKAADYDLFQLYCMPLHAAVRLDQQQLEHWILCMYSYIKFSHSSEIKHCKTFNLGF